MNKNNQGSKPEQDADATPGYTADNQPPRDQLIPQKGEEYLREVANIEDMPSPEEDEEAEDTLRNEEKKDHFRQ